MRTRRRPDPSEDHSRRAEQYGDEIDGEFGGAVAHVQRGIDLHHVQRSDPAGTRPPGGIGRHWSYLPIQTPDDLHTTMEAERVDTA